MTALFLFLMMMLTAANATLMIDIFDDPLHPGGSRWVFCGCATATKEGLIGGNGIIAPYKWNLGEDMLKNLGQDHYVEPTAGSVATLCSSEYENPYALTVIHLGYVDVKNTGTFAVATDMHGHIPILPGNEICWSGEFLFRKLNRDDMPDEVGINSLAGLQLDMYSDGNQHCSASIRSTC